MSVKSTYNFVPAPKESDVFKPKWACQVSQDIPFSDGESGEINITITAKTPIFIRNGHSKKDGEDKTPRYNSFSKGIFNGEEKYFIPATSVKGMVRNVLEIMSLSRMKAENDIFSFRALDNTEYKKEVGQNHNLKTGWLEKDGENWKIVECQVGRISIWDIKTKFNVQWTKKDKKTDKEVGLTAAEKYEALSNEQLIHNFNFLKKVGFKDKESLYTFNKKGNFKGELVFYGSMNNKKYEYFFTEGDGGTYTVDKDLIKRFEEIDNKLEGTLWQYFKTVERKRIPVFFKASNGQVEHFGFSRLYKISATKYLNEMEPLKSYISREDEYQPDLAETILGAVEDTNKKHGKNRNLKMWKGRVYFGHLQNTNSAQQLSDKTLVLASPKASYFPFYVQDGTYYSGNTLSGMKRYPVHQNIKNANINENNDDIETEIHPLNEGAVFKGKIRFHNLRKVEIGALLSALTFHGNDGFFHSLGGAKPFGYGKVKVDVNIGKLKHSLEGYLVKYEGEMANFQQNWIKENRIGKLFGMAKTPNDDNDAKLIYPSLELPGVQKKEANEFANYIKENTKLMSTEVPAVAFSGIKEKKDLEEKLKSGELKVPRNSLKDIKAFLKDMSVIPEEIIDDLKQAILTVAKNHNPSKKKLVGKPFDKQYEWHTTITKWLGKNEAQNLFNELKKD